MANSYTITKTDGTVLTTITEGQKDNTTTSLVLHGRGKTEYGQERDRNLVQLLENFANSTAPSSPIAGQLWFDTTSSVINVWNGSSWVPVGGAQTGGAAPSSPNLGTLWYDTNPADDNWATGVSQLKVYNGSSFVSVAANYVQRVGPVAPAVGTQQLNRIKLYTDNTLSDWLTSTGGGADPREVASKQYVDDAVAGSVGAIDLDDLGDVTITAPASDHMLRYNGSAWVNIAGSSFTPIANRVLKAGDTMTGQLIVNRLDGINTRLSVGVPSQLSIEGQNLILFGHNTINGSSTRSRALTKALISGSPRLVLNQGGDFSGGVAIDSTLHMHGNQIQQLRHPTASTHAATKGYVDAAAQSVVNSISSSVTTTGLYSGWVSSNGVGSSLPAGWSAVYLGGGNYRVTHNLGLVSTTDLRISATTNSPPRTRIMVTTLSNNFFDVHTAGDNSAVATAWMFIAIRSTGISVSTSASYTAPTSFPVVSHSVFVPNAERTLCYYGLPVSATTYLTANVIDGVGPFTYSWTFISASGSGGAFSVSGTNTRTLSLTSSAVPTFARTETWRCTVTDLGNGSAATFAAGTANIQIVACG